MERLEWSPTFSVGVRSIDEQHRKILGVINGMIASEDTTVRSETISEMLTRLTAYASEHFRTEEQLLSEHGFPGLETQRAEHKEYRHRVGAICHKVMRHEESAPRELLEFIARWWRSHILETDMSYKAFLAARGVS